MGGLYDILEAYRLQDPKFTYEGLYEDPVSKLATANPLKAIFNPNFEYRSPSFIERFAKEGATNPQGFVPIDYDRAIDFKRLFEDRPLKATDGALRFKDFNPRVGTITPYTPPNLSGTDDQASFFFPTNVQKGIMSKAPQKFEFLSSAYEDDDEEQVKSLTDQKSGITKLFEFLQKFSPIKALQGLGSMLDFSDSPMYRPATMGVYGYTPKELNRMNALGGYYSEPMRAYRRNVNRISNLMRRAAAGKNYSQKNLDKLMNQAGLGDVDTGAMIDSIKASADLGYGKGETGRKATPGRDYSSSPGALAGDMEYGEE